MAVASASAIAAVGAHKVDDLAALCRTADVLSIHAPALPATHNLIGAAELAWDELIANPIDALTTLAEIGHARTVLNLRRGPDPRPFDAVFLHAPAENKVENYDTANSRVRAWLRQVLEVVAEPTLELPIYIHCTSGKDRTGVVVAAVLTLLGVGRGAIVQEYLWSEGEVRQPWIEMALDGFGDVRTLIPGLDVPRFRARFLVG